MTPDMYEDWRLGLSLNQIVGDGNRGGDVSWGWVNYRGIVSIG